MMYNTSCECYVLRKNPDKYLQNLDGLLVIWSNAQVSQTYYVLQFLLQLLVEVSRSMQKINVLFFNPRLTKGWFCNPNVLFVCLFLLLHKNAKTTDPQALRLTFFRPLRSIWFLKNGGTTYGGCRQKSHGGLDATLFWNMFALPISFFISNKQDEKLTFRTLFSRLTLLPIFHAKSQF